MHSQNESKRSTTVMGNLPLTCCISTTLFFGDEYFEIIYCNSEITISKNSGNYAVIKLLNQQVPYKANILGGFAFDEEITGTIDYKPFFDIYWPDDVSLPEAEFQVTPDKIKREYDKGQKLEMGVEDVTRYHVIYQDEVTADIVYLEPGAYDFKFSTGLHGSFRKDPDGSHSIKFKGIRLDADEDGYNSESKFIFSRSKYTDNLILVMQDKATVIMEH